jgi:hypothetical protein
MKIKLYVQTNRVGSKEERTIDVPDEDWGDMDDLEKDDYMRDEMLNMVDWGYDEA